ncbi:unnamed protein product [Ilex paraguariensis]|uniref:Uncharacterized protein n=1 Tax=Ilex paraguariensis TaxID=185542 RepID=A0ABC8RE13_9AQUA
MESKKTGHVLRLDLRNPTFFDEERFYDDSDYATNYSRTCLRSKMSRSLRNLKHLCYMDLSMNNFSGIEIPECLGFLQNLRYLNFSLSNFRGNIPHHLGNLWSLRYLDLNDFRENALMVDSLWWVMILRMIPELELRNGGQVS